MATKTKIEPKLSKDNQLQVCLWVAEGRDNQEISDLLKAKGISMHRREIWAFAHRKKWAPVIAHLKHKFLTELSRIPIANKAVRLRYLQTVYREAMTESLKSRGKYGDVYEIKVGAATNAIEAARKEIEGEKNTGAVSGVQIPDIHITINVKDNGKDKAGKEFMPGLNRQAERGFSLLN